MLTRFQTRTLHPEHEPGTWFKVRVLAWPQLEQAREARVSSAVASQAERLEAMSAETIRKIREVSQGVAAPDAAEADPLDTYDQAMLLKLGVLEWSYLDEDGQPVPVDEYNLRDLDPETAEWLAREIAKPAKKRSEAEQAETFLSVPPGA